MNAPIAIDHLCYAKIHRGRHQRDRLVFAQAFDVDQKARILRNASFITRSRDDVA
jgi:hypothetical protein